jgi:protoheme IX farnesyltransferase
MSLNSTTIGRTKLFDREAMATLAELTKARLTSLVLMTTAAGYFLGGVEGLKFWGLVHALAGTGLLAGGAAALNQYLERAYDARMRRTANRPLPSGRIKPETALLLGGVLSVAGLVYLALAANLLTAFLGAVTIMSYLFIYTPLKRRTVWNTVIGAIPGALPPVMGWTAARGEIGIGGVVLFAILFLWQLPHFMAIAWLYREDYTRAGFQMLSGVDADGRRTGRQAVNYTVALLAASVLLSLFGLTGAVYLTGALALGAGFLLAALKFARMRTDAAARQLFLASILYQPLLLGLMVLDKIKQ